MIMGMTKVVMVMLALVLVMLMEAVLQLPRPQRGLCQEPAPLRSQCDGDRPADRPGRQASPRLLLIHLHAQGQAAHVALEALSRDSRVQYEEQLRR